MHPTPLPRSKQLELRRNVLSMMRERHVSDRVMPGILPFISCPRAPRPILPDTPMPNVLPTYIETIGSFIALSEVVSATYSSSPSPPLPLPTTFSSLYAFSFSPIDDNVGAGGVVVGEEKGEWWSLKYETALHTGTVETEDNWMIYLSPNGMPKRIHSIGHVLVKGI